MTPTEFVHRYYNLRRRVRNGLLPSKEGLAILAKAAWELSQKYEITDYSEELRENRRVPPEEPAFFEHLHAIEACVHALESRGVVEPTR